jgi:choline dehydrogenase-like flavoprotein
VLHEWEHERGAALLSAASLGPALARVADDVHARVVPEDAHDPANQVILRGARRLGWRATAARINAKGCIRTGMCGLGCRYHAKQSALAVYVPRALAAGARLLSSVRADRIELREHGGPAPLKRVHATLLERASGAPRGSLTIDAPVVVLAGGAVGTPVLLQRSGLGGGGVGEWLRLHPTTAVAGVYDDVVYQAAGIPQSSVCTEFHDIDDGFGYWIECPPYLPALASVATPGFGAGHARRMQQFTHSAALIVLARDGRDRARSAGRVRALRDGVRIDYRMGEHEWQLVRAGMRSAARLHLAAGARELLTLHGDLPPLHTEADLRHIDAARMQPNRVGLFSAHVNGTCRMGTERRTSGCSPDAERWGTPGLYIADGSILPSAPAVNPQWTIMAAARVVAEHVVERHRHSGV